MSGAGAQVREIVRPGSAFTALVSGSVVLAGLLCRCAGRAVGWAWDVASVDAEATGAAQAKADKAARAKASKAKAKARRAAKADQDDDAEDEDQEQDDDAEAEVAAPRVKPVRRPAGEAVGLAAFAGVLAAGTAGIAGTLLWPYVQHLGPFRGVLATAGGLAWMVAAWMLAPSSAPVEGDDQETTAAEGNAEAEEQPGAAEAAGPDRGTELLLHVVTALSDAEFSKRAGAHLDVVLASAVVRGLLDEGTEQAEFRAWVESCGLPTVDKLGMRIEGKPVTRVGLRVDAATEALGMTPTGLLLALSEAPTRPLGETSAEPAAAPAPAVGEGPAEAAASTPAQAPVPAPDPAALRLILGGRADPEQTPSPTLSQGTVQEAR
ncbi:hypothetical protein [Streptomyces sp. NPDC054901]